jgi:hypothetical protein
LLRARDEKLESLKAVAGKLAHDFNNFLVPQFGYVALLKEEMPGESGSAQYLGAMETATKRTEHYIESILLAMRPERQLSPSEFSLDAVLNDALTRWSAEAPPGMMVEVKSEIEPCSIMGDEKHWRNAVGQLLGNARYALATGGRLEVELARKQLSPEELVRLGLNTDDVYGLTVRDSGFGMSSSVAQRAFEPFFTTRTQIKAPGLGLTIVHSVALVHGGQVELRSAEEQGTTVTVWIPVNGFDARRAMGSGRTGRAGGGLEVHIASAPEEADRMMKTWGAELSLVITETDLRGAKGEEIFARLAEVNEGLPWIFLAGKRKPRIPEGAEDRALAPLVMQKPVTLRTLKEVVRRHVGV